jgi:hypothetical protein
MPWTLPPQPALATDRFILILSALWKWVWEKPGSEMTGPLSAAIRRKVTTAQARFTILARRFHDGTLAPGKPRAGPRAPPAAGQDAAPRTRCRSILPRRFGWLCRLVPSLASMAGSQMESLLKEPELEAMAAASPEVGRLIRSLLWMTGKKPPAAFAPPPRPRLADAKPVRARAGGAGPKAQAPTGPGGPRAARAAPVEDSPPPPPSAPPPPGPEALLVTPVIDPENWSHYSLIPGSRLKSR